MENPGGSVEADLPKGSEEYCDDDYIDELFEELSEMKFDVLDDWHEGDDVSDEKPRDNGETRAPAGGIGSKAAIGGSKDKDAENSSSSGIKSAEPKTTKSLDTIDLTSGNEEGGDKGKSANRDVSKDRKDFGRSSRRDSYKSRSGDRRRDSRNRGPRRDRTSENREKVTDETRRDINKTRRDIQRDKDRCAKDLQDKTLKQKVELAATGLVPPGLEDVIVGLTTENESLHINNEQVSIKSCNEDRRKSPIRERERGRYSPDRKRRRSLEKRSSMDRKSRQRYPPIRSNFRRGSPVRRKSPPRRRRDSPERRRRSPLRRGPLDRRSPIRQRSPIRPRSPDRTFQREKPTRNTTVTQPEEPKQFPQPYNLYQPPTISQPFTPFPVPQNQPDQSFFPTYSQTYTEPPVQYPSVTYPIPDTYPQNPPDPFVNNINHSNINNSNAIYNPFATSFTPAVDNEIRGESTPSTSNPLSHNVPNNFPESRDPLPPANSVNAAGGKKKRIRNRKRGSWSVKPENDLVKITPKKIIEANDENDNKNVLTKLLETKQISLSDFLSMSAKDNNLHDSFQAKRDVIARCEEAIHILSPEPQLLHHFVPKLTEVQDEVIVKDKFVSPLKRSHGNALRFTSDRASHSLADEMQRLVTRLSFPTTPVVESMQLSDFRELSHERTHGTQTDIVSCQGCALRHAGNTADAATQTYPDSADQAVQVVPGDFACRSILKNSSMSHLTAAQLRTNEVYPPPVPPPPFFSTQKFGGPQMHQHNHRGRPR